MAVGFLKFVCVWNLSYSARHGTLPEGRGHEQPPLWIRGASKHGWSVVVTGNVHKAAALFDAHLWFLGQAEASGKSASPPIKQSGMCLSNHWRVCVSLLFPLKASHTHPSYSVTFSTLALLIAFLWTETVHILAVVFVYFHLQLRGFFSFHAVSHSSSLSNFDSGLCEWWDLISHCRFDWHSSCND